MSPTRREALAQLAALVASTSALGACRTMPRWSPAVGHDPLDGTVADYQAGRRRGEWTAADVTARALERCHTDGARWRAIEPKGGVS